MQCRQPSRLCALCCLRSITSTTWKCGRTRDSMTAFKCSRPPSRSSSSTTMRGCASSATRSRKESWSRGRSWLWTILGPSTCTSSSQGCSWLRRISILRSRIRGRLPPLKKQNNNSGASSKWQTTTCVRFISCSHSRSSGWMSACCWASGPASWLLIKMAHTCLFCPGNASNSVSFKEILLIDYVILVLPSRILD